jgi:hypothetical protein
MEAAGDVESTDIPPPLTAVFPHNVQLLKRGVASWMNVPPPSFALLSSKRHISKTGATSLAVAGEDEYTRAPPPWLLLAVAALPRHVQLLNCGAAFLTTIPPP